MARKGKLSRDQKRKKKRAQRACAEAGHVVAYTGNKYKSDYYLETVMRTETGIYEGYVFSHRKLTDRQVQYSLEYLILQLRGEHREPPRDNPQTQLGDDRWEDLVAWRIKQNWDELFATQPR